MGIDTQDFLSRSGIDIPNKEIVKKGHLSSQEGARMI
jgi:hypothetical protein